MNGYPFDESLLADYRATATGGEAMLLETALQMFFVHRRSFSLTSLQLSQKAVTSSPEGTARLVLHQMLSMGALRERRSDVFESAPALLRYLDRHPPFLV